MKRKLRKVWGFRSWTPWKMLLAVLYYVACLLLLFFGMTESLPFPMSGYDMVIYRMSAFVLFLWALTPAIFLSETPYRKYLPLFRDKIGSRSFMGMMIIFLLFAYLFASVDDFHTEEYRTTYESYSQAGYEAYEAAKAAGSLPWD